MYIYIYIYISGHKWSTTQRVFKSHRSKMSVIYMLYIYKYIISINIYKLPSKFKIQVLSTSAKICRGDFRIFQFVLAIHWQKRIIEFSRKPCILNRQWLRHTSPFCQELWFILSWLRILVRPKLYRLLITHLNRWKRGQYFSRWLSCLGFFVCLCFGKRIHWPMLKRQVLKI